MAAETVAAGGKAKAGTGAETARPEPMMGSLFASGLSEAILSLDIMTMTPIEALNELYKLQQQAKEETGQA